MYELHVFCPINIEQPIITKRVPSQLKFFILKIVHVLNAPFVIYFSKKRYVTRRYRVKNIEVSKSWKRHSDTLTKIKKIICIRICITQKTQPPTILRQKIFPMALWMRVSQLALLNIVKKKRFTDLSTSLTQR